MPCVPDLFPQFAAAVSALSHSEITGPRNAGGLLLDRFEVGQRVIEQVYAPFDHVNPAALALREGKSTAKAAASAKVFVSFSGEPMRGNLIRMLDLIGVNRFLGIATTGSLWTEHASMVHFTSALRCRIPFLWMVRTGLASLTWCGRRSCVPGWNNIPALNWPHSRMQ